MTPHPPRADIEAIRAKVLKYEHHLKNYKGEKDTVNYTVLTKEDGIFISDGREHLPILCDEVESLRVQLADMDEKLYKAIDERADVYREICSLNTQYEQLEEQEKEVIEERDALRAEVERLREQWEDLYAQLDRDREMGHGQKVSRALYLMNEANEKARQPK